MGGIERVLELARRHLEMEVAFLAEFTDDRQVYRGLDGDASSFGFELDGGLPLAETYCRLMTAGDVPNAIADARAHPVVGNLAVTEQAGIGAYVGVPIRLRDGTLYGSFCCLSHDSAPVDRRDVNFLLLLADLIVDEVQVERELAAIRGRISVLLEHRSLDIALQPVVDLATGHVLGVEALARFPAGCGPPDIVFRDAHAAGLGIELESLAVRHAMKVLPGLGTRRYLAVNLAPEVVSEVFNAIGTLVDAGHQLVLEITEHAAVKNYTGLREALAPARARGVRLAIDDAGAGYASLHHIVELHPDIIKIDRSLIDGISLDRNRRSVITALVALADDMNAVTVAEGIERTADLAVARELGIGAGQGYLLARPSSDPLELTRWLAEGASLLPPADAVGTPADAPAARSSLRTPMRLPKPPLIS